MATQVHQRIAKRIPCSVGIGEQRHNGLVLNVSQGGLFVQTSAVMPAGEAVVLKLTPPEGADAIPVQARVVWKRSVPHELRTSAQGGIGLRIEQADERYFQHLAEWMRIEMGVRPDARLAALGEQPGLLRPRTRRRHSALPTYEHRGEGARRRRGGGIGSRGQGLARPRGQARLSVVAESRDLHDERPVERRPCAWNQKGRSPSRVTRCMMRRST